jgi:hypothetical protein
MTNNEPTLHDEAKDSAVEALDELQGLSVEGIPGRIDRVCTELYRIAEGCWLLGSQTWDDIAAGDLAKAGQTEQAMAILRDASALEAAVMSVLRILKPMGWDNPAIHQLDETLDLLLEHGKREEMIATFVQIYSDKDRGDKVEQLNKIFRKEVSNNDD